MPTKKRQIDDTDCTSLHPRWYLAGPLHLDAHGGWCHRDVLEGCRDREETEVMVVSM
jgi:hypothetical protein